MLCLRLFAGNVADTAAACMLLCLRPVAQPADHHVLCYAAPYSVRLHAVQQTHQQQTQQASVTAAAAAYYSACPPWFNLLTTRCAVWCHTLSVYR